MVFKYLSGGANGDLNNATDFGGFYNDTVLVADANTYTIYTYEGADIIDASRGLRQWISFFNPASFQGPSASSP